MRFPKVSPKKCFFLILCFAVLVLLVFNLRDKELSSSSSKGTHPIYARDEYQVEYNNNNNVNNQGKDGESFGTTEDAAADPGPGHLGGSSSRLDNGHQYDQSLNELSLAAGPN